jgi:hypothetical protein
MWGEKKPRPIKLRVEWVRLYPRRGWHIPFWLAVAKEVKERKVRHKDDAKIKLICERIDRRMK